MLDRVTPLLMPPTSSTLPSFKSVAVWPERPVDRFWLGVNVTATGYERYLGEQSATGPRAASIARKLEWLSKRRSSEVSNG